MLVVVFYPSFVRRLEDDNECCVYCRLWPWFHKNTKDHDKCSVHSGLLCKGTRLKKKDKEGKKKKRLMYIYLPQMYVLFFRVTFFITVFQQRFLLHRLQQCLLQHCFNTISATLSLLCSDFAITIHYTSMLQQY